MGQCQSPVHHASSLPLQVLGNFFVEIIGAVPETEYFPFGLSKESKLDANK
jgi:hypothetical protein